MWRTSHAAGRWRMTSESALSAVRGLYKRCTRRLHVVHQKGTGGQEFKSGAEVKLKHFLKTRRRPTTTGALSSVKACAKQVYSSKYTSHSGCACIPLPLTTSEKSLLQIRQPYLMSGFVWAGGLQSNDLFKTASVRCVKNPSPSTGPDQYITCHTQNEAANQPSGNLSGTTQIFIYYSYYFLNFILSICGYSLKS